MKKQRILTGTRPSGKAHFGNYFGAYKPAIDFQKDYEVFFFLADLHALNGTSTPEEIREQSIELTATMLACGLDPNKTNFYTQSALPEVAELAWYLGCQAPYGLMLRAHSFKDAQAKGIEINMGVFNYPVLMAADILLYDAHRVPVGKDQKQHLEMTRDIAQRFNTRYGEDFFVLPDPVISEAVAVIPGTDGEKMSSSKGNVVPIFASDKQWKKAVMSIVSDSKGLDDPKDPDTCNIFALLKLLAPAELTQEIAAKYRSGGYGYGHAKQELLGLVQENFSAARDQYDSLMKDRSSLIDVLNEGARRVRPLAREKLEKTREKLGLVGKPIY